MTDMRHRNDWYAKRVAAGLSIRELARRSGVNRGTISRIERGWPATAKDAAALTRVLDEGGAP